ncbi:hypothetical protein RMATCC62417_15244 [Rhizopus microsporus]|nr:hypothetical protein RMATCC62417_15244 [Rhizopus microsporus]
MTGPRGLKTSKPLLSSEQIQQLNAQFAALRATLTCLTATTNTLSTSTASWLPNLHNRNTPARTMAKATMFMSWQMSLSMLLRALTQIPSLPMTTWKFADNLHPAPISYSPVSRLIAELSQTRAKLQKAQEEITNSDRKHPLELSTLTSHLMNPNLLISSLLSIHLLPGYKASLRYS